jgi:hypothetical protein
MIERPMKKILILAFLLLCQREHLFPATVLSINSYDENWLTLSLNYGFFFKNPFDPQVTADNQYGSFGASLTFLSFSNWSNWGLFAHAYFLFPDAVISTKNGGMIDTEEKIDNMIGFILGPAYRVMLQTDAYLYFAFGAHFRLLSGSYSTELYSIPGEFLYDLSGNNFGVGGDIGFKFDLSEIFHLSFGVTLMVDITSEVLLKDSNRAPPKYLWISAKPYFGFGASINVERSWYLIIGD